MIVTLEEAIAREEGIVAENERFCAVAPSESAEAYHSATYHRQIAEWLKELAGRKTGKWIDTGSGQECSCCMEIQYGYDNGRRYCPNCGAKMEVDG